jgi:hypothetical protein
MGVEVSERKPGRGGKGWESPTDGNIFGSKAH